MDYKVLEALIIPKDNLSIANEGLGIELFKYVGKSTLHILKIIAIFIGIPICAICVILGKAFLDDKRHNDRYNNPTKEELLSRENFKNSWKPKFNEFLKMVVKDIDTVNESDKIKKYLFIESPNNKDTATNGAYSFIICSINWSKVQYPGAAGDDNADPEKLKDFCNKLQKLKPYISKWKATAKKFEPYFKLEIIIDEDEKSIKDGWADFNIYFVCKWIDKDGILKPGLPELK